MSEDDELHLVMDDTFDEKAAKAEYDALPESDKMKIQQILDNIH